MLVEECYRAGASKVIVDWSHQPISKLHNRHRSLKTMSKMEDWEVAKLKHQSETLPVRIYLESDDPDGLKGINQAKLSKASQARYKIIKPFREAMDNKYQWCIAAVPGAAWAKKVFPNETRSRAIEKLWEAILYTARVDEDPVAAWNAHNTDLAACVLQIHIIVACTTKRDELNTVLIQLVNNRRIYVIVYKNTYDVIAVCE